MKGPCCSHTHNKSQAQSKLLSLAVYARCASWAQLDADGLLVVLRLSATRSFFRSSALERSAS